MYTRSLTELESICADLCGKRVSICNRWHSVSSGRYTVPGGP